MDKNLSKEYFFSKLIIEGVIYLFVISFVIMTILAFLSGGILLFISTASSFFIILFFVSSLLCLYESYSTSIIIERERKKFISSLNKFDLERKEEYQLFMACFFAILFTISFFLKIVFVKKIKEYNEINVKKIEPLFDTIQYCKEFLKNIFSKIDIPWLDSILFDLISVNLVFPNMLIVFSFIILLIVIFLAWQNVYVFKTCYERYTIKTMILFIVTAIILFSSAILVEQRMERYNEIHHIERSS
jgi:hypothetical protein